MTTPQFNILNGRLSVLSLQLNILILQNLQNTSGKPSPADIAAVEELIDQAKELSDHIGQLQDRYDRSTGAKPLTDKD